MNNVSVAAVVSVLLQTTTKRRSGCFLVPSLSNNVLVTHGFKDIIVCFSAALNLKHNLPQRRQINTSAYRFASLNNTLFNNNNNNKIVMAPKKRVSIIGSGNWGSAIAKITGNNVSNRSSLFEPQINMYVYEEEVNGRKLTEIINTDHENLKYLPGIKLPENVVAVPDVIQVTSDADILVFVLPHQFVKGICKSIKGKLKTGAIAVSLIKGFDTSEGGIKLVSDVISENLGIECAVLMGANLAHEVANESFCESTIGAKNKETGITLRNLFDGENFRCSVVNDSSTVEACGALKNIVAVGSGIVDGLKLGDNTKAAALRLGLMEMIDFIDIFFKGAQLRTFFESSGLADLVTTCQGGRNRKLGEALVNTNKSVPELEKEILNGQSFQGPPTAKEVYVILKERDILDRCPMFVAVHLICQRELEPIKIIDALKSHPIHSTG